MIRLLTGRARIGLVVAAMAVAVAMVAFAQTTEPAIESVPLEAEAEAVKTSSTGDENGTDKDTSVQIEQPVAVESEIQRRINKLRSEFLDDRAGTIEWWLTVIAIVLTFFGIIVAIFGIVFPIALFWAFGRFQKIETEAKNSSEASNEYATAAKEQAAAAKKLVEEIKEKRDESEKLTSER